MGDVDVWVFWFGQGWFFLYRRFLGLGGGGVALCIMVGYVGVGIWEAGSWFF